MIFLILLETRDNQDYSKDHFLWKIVSLPLDFRKFCEPCFYIKDIQFYYAPRFHLT